MSIMADKKETGVVIDEPSAVTSKLARCVAPEDLNVGDFVAVLHETYEFPSFFWCDLENRLQADELVALRFKSRQNGKPLQVVDICLPFVLVEEPDKKHATIDVRFCELAKLDAGYAKNVRKSLKKGAAKKVT